MTVHLCDSNVWLALAVTPHAHHAAVRRWLDSVDEPASVLFCRATQQSFLRLVTTASVFAPYGMQPLTNSEAWAAYDVIAADDRIGLREGEPFGLESRWRAFATRDTASQRLWMDAYLAAFARNEGCRMVTTDAGFKQFSGLDLLLLE